VNNMLHTTHTKHALRAGITIIAILLPCSLGLAESPYATTPQDKEQINRLLDEYQDLFERMDMNALKTLFTTDSSTAREFLTWSNTGVIRQAITLDVKKLTVGFSRDLTLPHDASAIVSERTERLSRTGKLSYAATTATYFFRKISDGWKIYERAVILQGIDGKPATFSIDSDEAAGHASIGLTYLTNPRDTQDIQKGVHELLEATRLSPDRADWQFALAQGYSVLGNTEAAEAAYREALRFSANGKWPPSKLGLQFALAMIHDAVASLALQRSDLIEADLHFSEALRLNPNHPGALNGLGIVRLLNNDLDQATLFFLKSTEIYPEDAQAKDSLKAIEHYRQALLLIDKGDFETAKTLLRKAIQLRPDFAPAYFELTVALNMEADNLRNNGQLEQAILKRKESLEFAPTYYPNAGAVKGGVHEKIALDFFNAKRYEEAIPQFQLAAELGRDKPGIYCSLGICHYKLGHKERSAEYFRMVVADENCLPQYQKVAKQVLATMEMSGDSLPGEKPHR
jgi:tetratricopeptide (TPR) repeat protein